MCDDFGQVVSDSIYELHVLKKKATSKDVICSGLLCGCKQKLLSNYLAISSNLMNLSGALSQALSVITDVDSFNDRMKAMKSIFRESALHDLVTKDGVSSVACPKMIILFYIIQKQMEDVLFEEMSRKLLPFLGSKNGEKIKICREILDDIYDFTEAAVFTLSGLRINCYNISEDIYKHPFSPIKECPTNINKHEARNCIFLSGRQKVECLHLFMTDSFVKVKRWIDTYFDLFKQYHKAPEHVHLIIDFKLMDKYTWTEEDCSRYKELQDFFGCVYVVNSEHIDFNGFEVDTVDIHDIKECVLQCDLNTTS